MPRSLDEMICELADVLAQDPERSRAAEAARTAAEAIATRLPFVHRTGKSGPKWRDLFQQERLAGGVPCTRWERENLKVGKVTYFFWGYAAYPKGNVALLLAALPANVGCMATPFDTGGCEKGRFVRGGCELSDTGRVEVLDQYTLSEGLSVVQYGAHYLAAHFCDPVDYIRRQQESRPDHSPYHGLESGTNDRLAWTIEVQVHDDVPIPPDKLSRVVLQGRDLFRELPIRYRRIAAVPPQEDDTDFGQGVAKTVLSLMGYDG